jgi:hypothetical protein
MVNFEVYVKGILEQIDDSYTLLQNLRDKPGDLEIIKRETAKITGLLQALANKFVTNKDDLSDYQHLVVPTCSYLNSHDFFREIDTMALLYSDDALRLKNLRLTIIDALSERNLIEHIKATLRENS